ncbi:hypothetical protein C8F01DRAFT_1087984 [Mycena amicta]|nr:hypothetical protein C8F01DRAFT_1087984 [Mycena amicta]
MKIHLKKLLRRKHELKSSAKRRTHLVPKRLLQPSCEALLAQNQENLVQVPNLVILDDPGAAESSRRQCCGGDNALMRRASVGGGQKSEGQQFVVSKLESVLRTRVGRMDPVKDIPVAELPFCLRQNQGSGVGKSSHTSSRPPPPTRYLTPALSFGLGRVSSANRFQRRHYNSVDFRFPPSTARRSYYLAFGVCPALTAARLHLARLQKQNNDFFESGPIVVASCSSNSSPALPLTFRTHMSTELVDKRDYPHGLDLILQAINGQDVEQEDVHTPSIVASPMQIEPLFFSDSEDDAYEPPSPLPTHLFQPFSFFSDSDSDRGQTPLFLPSSDIDSDRGTPRPERPPPPLFPPDSDVESERGTTPTPAIRFLPPPSPPYSAVESHRGKRFLPVGGDTDDDEAGTPKPIKKKARKQRFTARDFFDVEAVDTDGNDSGDEADSEDDGFIDNDEPMHEFPPPRRLPLLFGQGGDDSPEDLEALAAKYEVAARQQRRHTHTRQTEVPAKDWTLDEKLKLPRPNSLTTIDSPPIFAIRVPPRWEFSLLAFLAQDRIAEDAGILSAFSWGIRSGLVCVEVRLFDRDDNQILRPASGLIHALSQWPHAQRCYKDAANILGPNLLQPREVPSTEKICLLCPPTDPRFLDPFRIGRRWVRITDQMLYTGDLAFVEEYSPKTSLDRDDYDDLHVVPRVALNDKEERMKRPPQRLIKSFSDYDLLKQIAEVELRNQICVWQKRIFGRLGNFDGLERIQVKQWRYQTPSYELNAIPTEEELDMFRQSPSRALNVPFTGHACALQEGDRVVVAQEQVNPYWDAKSGVIVRLATHSIGGKPTRIALLLRSYDGVSQLDAHSPELKDAWAVPVALLRLHLLAFQRHLRFGDRVRVVAGAYRDRCAHVIGVDSGTIKLCLSPATSRAASIESPTNIELPL